MYIICSIGPGINNVASIKELYEAGMNAARYNFSHVDYKTTEHLINYTRKNFPDLKVIQDLQGNKLRVASAFKGEVMVKPGDKVVFCSEREYNTLRVIAKDYIVIPISFEGDFSSLFTAKSILMKDATMKFGIVNLRQKNCRNELIKAITETGGLIRAEKGINAPGMDRSGIGLTKKDKEDILWGLENKVDIICLSYTCSMDNTNELKDFINKNNKWNHSPKLWAKIESKEGIKNFKSILDSADGIMLGRGDLYAEIDVTLIPYIQDNMLNIMKNISKDFIIASYVLPSMRSSTMPRISELNDIYNCIKRNVSGFMLSTEVSTGKYPVQVVKVLKKMVDKYYKSKE